MSRNSLLAVAAVIIGAWALGGWAAALLAYGVMHFAYELVGELRSGRGEP